MERAFLEALHEATIEASQFLKFIELAPYPHQAGCFIDDHAFHALRVARTFEGLGALGANEARRQYGRASLSRKAR
jgi:hypothetical protein